MLTDLRLHKFISSDPNLIESENFLENYAEIHGLPNPGRNVTQSLTLLPAETSYKSVYCDFIAGLENGNTLKYDAFRKLYSNRESKN